MKSGEVCGKKLIDAYSPTPDEIDAALDLYGLYRSERDALLTSGKIADDVVARLMKELKVDCYATLPFWKSHRSKQARVSMTD